MTKNKKIRTEKKGTHPFQPSRDYYGDDIAETLGYTEKKILVKTKIKATTKNSVKTNVKRISTGTKTTSLNKIGSVLSSVLLVMTPKTKKKIKTKTESMKRKITRKINLSKNKITKAARAVKRKSKSSYYNNEVKENLKFKNEIKEKDFRAFIERLAEWKESWKEKILSRRRARAEIRAQNFIRKRFEKLRKLIELKKNKIKDKTQTKTNLKNNLREKAGELIGKITGILFRSRIKSDGEDDASRISRFSSKNGSSAQVSWKNKAGNSRKTIKNNSYLDNYAKVSGKYIKNFGNVIKKCKGSVAQWIEQCCDSALNPNKAPNRLRGKYSNESLYLRLTNYINKTKEEINKCTVRATGCSGEARTFSNWVRFPTRTHRYLKQGYNNYLKVSEEKKKENKGSNRVWSKTTSLPGLPSQIDKRKNLFNLNLSKSRIIPISLLLMLLMFIGVIAISGVPSFIGNFIGNNDIISDQSSSNASSSAANNLPLKLLILENSSFIYKSRDSDFSSLNIPVFISSANSSAPYPDNLDFAANDSDYDENPTRYIDLIGENLNSPPSFSSTKNPSKSSDLYLSLSSLENDSVSDSGLYCGILNKTTENILFFGYKEKSTSLVTSTLFSDLENDANFPFESPFGLITTSYSPDLKNSSNLFFTFSSNKNLTLGGGAKDDIISPFGDLGNVMQGCLDLFFSERPNKRASNLFDIASGFEHLQNLPDHDSSAFESGLAMADLGIHDNEFINLDSHDSSTEKKIFKDFGENLLQSIKNRINYLSNSLYKIGKGFSSITGAAIGIQDYRTQDAGDDLTEGLTTYEYTPNTNPSEFYLTNTSGSLVPYIYENLGGGNRLIRIKDNNGEQRYLFNFGGIYLSKDGQVQAHFDFFKLEFYNNSVDEWQTTSYNGATKTIDVIQEENYTIFNATARFNEDNDIEANLEFRAGYDIEPISKLTYRVYDNLNRTGWNNQLHRVTWDIDQINVDTDENGNISAEDSRIKNYGDLLIDWRDMKDDIHYEASIADSQVNVTFYQDGKAGNLVIDPGIGMEGDVPEIGNSYVKDGKQTNLTLETTVNNRPMDVSLITTPWIENLTNEIGESDGELYGYKFGFNFTIPNTISGENLADNLQEIKFSISSEYSLEKYGNGFRYFKGYSEGGINNRNREYVTYEFSDILDRFNLTPENLSVNVNGNNADVVFNFSSLDFNINDLIDLDPTITNDVENSSRAINVNVSSTDYSFSHITVNDSNLEVYYSFDVENKSDAITYDLSDNNNDGDDITNATWDTDGIIGGAYSFEGLGGGRIRLPADFNLTGRENFTMLIWIKPNITNIQENVYGENIHALGMNSLSNAIRADLRINGTSNNPFSTSNQLTAGIWTHIGMTWNGSNLTIWSNGESVGGTEVALNETGDPFPVDSAGTLRPNLGRRSDAADQFLFNGTLDEFMFFNRTLDGDEIRSIYQNTSYRFKGPLAGQIFREEENLIDISQNGSLNAITLTTNTTQLFNTEINARIHEWDGISYNDSIDGDGAALDGLVLAMHFDNRSDRGENDSDFFDYSGNENNGTGFNFDNDELINGRFGGFGVDLDGSNDYINTTDIEGIDTTTNLTVSSWVYHNSITNDDLIVEKSDGVGGGGFIFFRDDTGSVSERNDIYKIRIDDGADSGFVEIEGAEGSSPLQTWTHVIFTITLGDANGLRLYVNGVEDVNSPTSTVGIQDINATGSVLSIGTFTEGSNFEFNGTIDEVYIWNRTLTADEIEELYKIGKIKRTTSDWQRVTDGDNQETNFNISTGTNYTSIEYNFSSDSNNFYTPYLKDDVVLDSHSSDEGSGTFIVNETDTSRFSFSEGTLQQTNYSYDKDAIILDNSSGAEYYTNGNFTSQIFDLGHNVRYLNVSWVGTAQGELLEEQSTYEVDSGYYVDGINMTGNVLLMRFNKDEGTEYGRGNNDSLADAEVIYHFNQESEFGENSTVIYDFSGSDNNGTAENRTAAECGTDGACPDFASDSNRLGRFGLNLDGEGDRVELPATQNLSRRENFSMFIWVKPNQTDTNVMIYGENSHQFGIRLGADNDDYYISLTVNNSARNVVVNNIAEVGVWAHLGVTWNGSVLGLWKDGKIIGDNNLTLNESGDPFPVDAAAGVPALGSLHAGNANEMFNGSLDEFIFFNRTLEGSEILELYNRGVNVTDYSGNENNGNITEGINSVDSLGNLKQGFEFDGVNDYIIANNSNGLNFDSGTDDYTISLWFNQNSQNNEQYLIVKRTTGITTPFSIYINSSNNMVVDAWDGIDGANSVGSSRNIGLGTWYNVVAVYTAPTNAELFINGVSEASGIVDDSGTNTQAITIGQKANALSYFNGTIDEVAIWNRTLTEQEIYSMYRRGATRLNISLMSCDDSSCSGESFIQLDNQTSPQEINVNDNRYFQYNVEFNTTNETATPELYNFTIFERTDILEFCDFGDTQTTCYINSTKYLNETYNELNANNLVINGSGAIENGSSVEFVVNLDGNLIIEDTGLINLTADTCSGSCPGGNLTIDAAGVINVTGNITADAGLYTGVNFNSVGGNIYINSSSMFIETNAVISASSDYLTSSANDYSGDKAGIIIINSTGSVENLGTIQVIGGNADTNDCSIGGDARGRRGDGGNINITGTEITNNGLINVEKGLLGQCLTNGLVVNDAQDGLIYLNDTFSPCNNGTIFDPGSCVISKPIRVPHNEIINFSGYNWTLGNGAWLNGDADYSEDTAALTVNATDFTLIVDILNLSGGNITSYGTLHSASGGTIIINASQIFINENSKISASAEDISLTVSLDRPQAYGGTINLTASIINSTGKITTNGKNGDIDDCIPGSRGPSGDGGNIFIDADEVVVEELSVRRGIGDLCDLGLGGIIEVNATTSFTGTGLISAYGNYSGNITIISPSIDINSTINTTSPDTIVNGTTILDFSNFINLSSAVIEPGPILIRNTTEGRIEYLERVGDSVTSLTDLNMSMNISINLIEVDGESGDAALNRTAEIWIYNSSFISFDDTLILKDGANCTDCNKISYDQVTYIFNVSSFTNYSILDAIPTTPVLTSPENDSLIGSIYPRLKWENTSDPDDTTTYYLEVYNDSDLTLLVYNNPAVPDSDNPVEDQINISLEDGDYFWRVLATGALENGTVYNSSYSELWTFTVNASSSTFRQNANGTEIKDRFEYGTFVQTNLTTFGDRIILDNESGAQLFTNGNFTSQILDSGVANTSWDNVSWVGTAQGELLEEQSTYEVDSGYYVDGINMTGNVLLMRFNSNFTDNDNETLDSSGNNNNGTVHNTTEMPEFVSGFLGAGAFEFDGIDDYIITINDSTLDSTSAISITSWIKRNSLGQQNIITNGINTNSQDGWRFEISNTNFLRFFSSRDTCAAFDSTTASSNQLTDLDTWHHVAVIWDLNGDPDNDDSLVRLFVDGKEPSYTDQRNITTTLCQQVNPIQVGIFNGTDNPFNGTIDEVAIFNRTLSASEIYSLYRRGATRLNLSVRSCDDASCSGESFIQLDNQTSSQNLSGVVVDNRYFQYNVEFNTTNETATPELYNVTISHTTEVSEEEFFDQESDLDTNVLSNDSSVYLNEITYFYANYTSNNNPITSASCDVIFADTGTNSMSYDSGLGMYLYSRTFTNDGNFSWTTTCTRSGYTPQTRTSSVIIQKALYEHIFLTPAASYTNDTLSGELGFFINTGNDEATANTTYTWYKNGVIIAINDLASNGTATASNEEGGAANNAIDDNNDTMWQTAAAQLTSAQITFNITNTSTTHKIGKLDFRFGGDQSPDEFNISYSTDNSAYTNIFTNISDSGTNLTATLNFDAVTAQYIRFDFANPLNEFGIGGLHEFNVYTTDTLEEEYFIASDSIYFTVTPNLNESGDGYVIANSSNRLLIDDDQGDFNNGSCDSNCFVNETGIYLSEDNTSAYFTSQEFDTQRITPNLIRIIWNNTDQDGFNVSLQTRTSQDNITWNEWQGQGFLADENTLILLHFNNNLSGANNEIEQSNDSQSFANTKWQEGVLINGTASLAYNGTYINRSEGTISFWIKPNWTIENETVYLFDLAYNETYDRISLYIDNTTLIFRIRDAEDRDHQLNETINFTAEDLHNIIAVWNNSNMSLFIDNVSVPGTHISSEIKEEQNTLFLERFESAAYLESTGNVSGNYLAGKHDQGLMINETGHNANFSSTNNMNETLGTIEFWIRPEWNGNDGTQYYLFDTAQSATVNRISLIKDTDDWLRMAVYDTGGTLHTLSYNISNWTAQDFRSVAVNYNFSAAAMEMYINDELVNSTSETSFSVTLGTAIIIGNNRDLNAAANATIDSFRISDTVLNAFNYSYTDDTIPMNNTADYFSIGSDFNNLSQANSSFDEFAVYNISDKDSSEFYSTYYNESFLIPYPYYRYIQYRTLLQGDGNNFSSYLNRTIIEQENFEIVIKNFAPTNTSLESPENDTNITTPGVAFNWANSTDADNDIIYYDLEIATDAEFTSITNIIANISQGSNYSLLSDEELADGTYYWRVRAGDNFTVTQVDEINYSDYTEIQIFSIDSVFPLIFDESRNPAGTITEIEDVTFFVNVSELNIDTVWLSGNWTGSYENITLNVFDGNSTDRRYNYTVNSANWSVNEVIDWDFYINDTAGNENTTANDDDFTIQSSVDLNVSDIFTPSIVYSNSTTINISVGNDAAGTATDANVTCYADDTPIDSYLITLTGFETNTTGFCTYTFTFGNVTFNATVDPDNALVESNETNNDFTVNITVYQKTTFDAFDQEDDEEDNAAWLSEQTELLPGNTTFTFGNYTRDDTNLNVTNTTGDLNVSILYSDGTSADLDFNDTEGIYYNSRSFTYAGNYTWNVTANATQFEYHERSSSTAVKIPLQNSNAVGIITENLSINDLDRVNISILIPAAEIDPANQLGTVWVEINNPNGTITNDSMTGAAGGGGFELVYNNTVELGDYALTYYANLSDGFELVQAATAYFSVKNITIAEELSETQPNTTTELSISGQVNITNSSVDETMNNYTINIFLDNELEHNNFTAAISGSDDETNSTSGEVVLNTSDSSIHPYLDDFSDQSIFQRDAVEWFNVGNSSAGQGWLFDTDDMISGEGNITYRLANSTDFRNIEIWATIGDEFGFNAANVSIYYSLDNTTFNILNSTSNKNLILYANLTSPNSDIVYIQLRHNGTTGPADSTLDQLEINWTIDDYATQGTFTSNGQNLGYDKVSLWRAYYEGTTPTNTEIILQTASSSDNSSWSDWSGNLTQGQVANTTGERYARYRALLTTTNVSATPTLTSVIIGFNNVTTNLSGFYNYTFTVPTTVLGTRTLIVNVTDEINITGENSTTFEAWAITNITNATNIDYSGSETNFSIEANYTREDINENVPGLINITVYEINESNDANLNISVTCDESSTCLQYFTVPTNLSFGNYTFNTTGENTTYYYHNASAEFMIQLEEKSIAQSDMEFDVENKTITDFISGTDYSFLHNASINNTGRATVYYVNVTNTSISSNVISIANTSTDCETAYANTTCLKELNITISESSVAGTDENIFWRLEWENNDGTRDTSGSAIQRFIIIQGNPDMDVNTTNITADVEHSTRFISSFQITANGSSDISNANVSWINDTMPEDWLTFNPEQPNFTSITAGSSQDVEVIIAVPYSYDPGNYNGTLNVTSDNTNSLEININISVPTNLTWDFLPQENISVEFALNTPGEIQNITVNNTGNEDLNLTVAYSPFGEFDYTGLGDTLFQAPDTTSLPGETVNPINATVPKNESVNLTIWQKGDSTPRNYVGVAVNMSNESAIPTSNVSYLDFNITDQPPTVTNLTFFRTDATIEANHTEVNQSIQIRVIASDDIGLSTTGTTLNITWEQSDGSLNSTNLSADVLQGSGTQINFSANFTPEYAGMHNVTATITDTSSNQADSIEFNFSSVETTAVDLGSNISQADIETITQTIGESFFVNFSINNSGDATAYYSNLTIELPAGVTASLTEHGFENLTEDYQNSTEINFTVAPATANGTSTITASFEWEDANTSRNSNNISITVNITANSILSIDAIETLDINHSSSNSTVIYLNNTGNVDFYDINMSCDSGDVCNTFTVTFNETDTFNLTAGSIRQINLSIDVPAQQAPGTYTGTINASSTENSTRADITVTIPTDDIWSAAPSTINITAGRNEADDAADTINITNSGNIDIFLNISNTNTTLIETNYTENVTVTKGATFYVKLNFTAPDIADSYFVNVSFENDTLTSLQNFTSEVTINVTNFTVTIQNPLEANQTTNITSGDSVDIEAVAVLGGVNVTSDVTWTVQFDSTDCPVTSSSYSDFWTIFCTAPSLTDGINHSLSVTGSHQNSNVTDTQTNALLYRDVTAPVFNNESKEDVEQNDEVTLLINVTDNIELDSVRAIVEYPNGTKIEYTMTNASDDLFELNLSDTEQLYDYNVEYIANDTTNNSAAETEIFEVFLNKNLNGTIVNYNNEGVETSWSLYRTNTTTALTNFSTNSTGQYNENVHMREYDIEITVDHQELLLSDSNVSDAESDPIDLDEVAGSDLTDTITNYKPLIGLGINNTFNFSTANVTLNYTGISVTDEREITIFHCDTWDYTGRTCNTSWTEVGNKSLDIVLNTVEAEIENFSAYMSAENTCGDGVCQEIYGETTTSCVADCVTAQGGGAAAAAAAGGGGGGGLSSSALDILKTLIAAKKKLAGIEIEPGSISRELLPGETVTAKITLRNTLRSQKELDVRAEGDAAALISLPSTKISIGPAEEKVYTITITAPSNAEPGNYEGNLILSIGEEETAIPVSIRILTAEGKLLDVKISPLRDTIEPGDILKVQVELFNLGTGARSDVEFGLQLLNPVTEEIITKVVDSFAVETSISVVRDLGIPKDILLGRYVVKGIATYESQGRILEATALSPITVTRPLLQRQYFGISIGQYIIIALIMMLNWSAYLFYKAKQEKKLRYKKVIDYSSLPQPGARSAFVGKIAETGVRAFMDLDRLQTHTLIAGATGSGKTVAAMDIIEEALKKEVAVMIFDPTSQWSGFFRKCNDKKMLKRFKYFEMSVDDAQSFKGELHTITNPREFIDITTYLKPGTIAVFNTSKLRPEDLDIIVASTIEQIFRQNLPGSHRLKTLIVYDEVHRLLPKFGGSGQGLVQLERGAREFRKWGIGLVLISQVLSDFVGEIKANIGTEMQMRTVYEGDLERVKMKYGEEVQQSVVREAVGTGMVVNAEYNHGRPYFVSFRPILHSTFALTPKAVDAYEKYNERIRELRYQLQQLEELKVDVYDLQLELNLAAVKAQQGQFNMADIYMESIEPRILDQWKKIGKKPKKLEVRLIGEKEIQRGIELAERARAEYMQALEKQKVKTAIELETGEKEKEKEKSYVTEPSPARPEEARKREKAAKEKEAEKIKVEKKEGEEKEKVKIAGAETGAKKEGLIKILKNKLKR